MSSSPDMWAIYLVENGPLSPCDDQKGIKEQHKGGLDMAQHVPFEHIFSLMQGSSSRLQDNKYPKPQFLKCRKIKQIPVHLDMPQVAQSQIIWVLHQNHALGTRFRTLLYQSKAKKKKICILILHCHFSLFHPSFTQRAFFFF